MSGNNVMECDEVSQETDAAPLAPAITAVDYVHPDTPVKQKCKRWPRLKPAPPSVNASLTTVLDVATLNRGSEKGMLLPTNLLKMNRTS